MNNYMTLLKVDLLNSLAFNNFKNSKKVQKKSKEPLIAIIISFVSIFLLMTLYGLGLGIMARGTEYSYVTILFGFVVATFMTIMMSFGKSYAILFQARDYDLLCSLPVKTSTIISSKLSSFIIVVVSGLLDLMLNLKILFAAQLPACCEQSREKWKK